MTPTIPPIDVIAAIAVVIFFAIGIHEYAHCKFADMAGDPTPSLFGRVTLNLTKHFEPVGTIMMVITHLTGFGIGWGKPAPMDPRKMRNPRWDHFAAVAAGPISNVVQAVIYAVILRLCLKAGLVDWGTVIGGTVFRGEEGVPTTFLASLLGIGVLTNISLALFNLLPIAPLDGHWLVGDLLPERQSVAWLQWQRRYGNGILLILILLGQFGGISLLGRILGPPTIAAFRLLTGAPI